MIHHTRGVYPDLSYKDNGVRSENIAHHTSYNMRFRPGRALFVDGVCIYKGRLSEEQITQVLTDIKDVTMEKDTAPYV